MDRLMSIVNGPAVCDNASNFPCHVLPLQYSMLPTAVGQLTNTGDNIADGKQECC